MTFLLAAGAIDRAWATCGSANCFLVTGTEEGVGGKGHFIVDLSYRYIDQDRKLRGTEKVDDVLTPKVDFEGGALELDHHREVRTQNTLVEVDMAYGLTDRLTLAWALPIINERSHEHFEDAGTPSETFTNQDGSSGFGDVRLGARYALMVRTKDILIGSLFVKLPTGAYKLLDSEGAINEPTIQPGSGSTDGIVSVLYSHQVVPNQAEWFASASQKKNGVNGLEYRFGDDSQGAIGWRYKTTHDVSWSIQINGRRTLRDTFLGQSVPSTGSTILHLTPGVRLEGKSGSSIYAFVQLPVYEKVNESNLAPRFGLVLGLSHAF